MGFPRTLVQVLLLVVYAAAVWYALYSWRRSWRGLVIWIGAVGLLLLVAVLHYWSWLLSRGWIIQPPMRVMLYPYIALVGAAGMIFYLMPRTGPGRPCPRCRYDVTGLCEEGRFTCPECGSEHARPYPIGTVIEECFSCKANLRGTTPRPDVRCHRCGALHVIGAVERGLTSALAVVPALPRSSVDPAVQGSAPKDQERDARDRQHPQHAQLPGGE